MSNSTTPLDAIAARDSFSSIGESTSTVPVVARLFLPMPSLFAPRRRAFLAV